MFISSLILASLHAAQTINDHFRTETQATPTNQVLDDHDSTKLGPEAHTTKLLPVENFDAALTNVDKLAESRRKRPKSDNVPAPGLLFLANNIKSESYNDVPDQILASNRIETTTLTTASPAMQTNQAGIYKQLRNLTTVRQVWDEYTKGLNGNPSIQRLDADYKNSWRLSPSDSSFYYATTPVYNFLRNLIKKEKTEDEAVADLEAFRVYQGWNLAKLKKMNPLMTIDADGRIQQVAAPSYKQFRNLTTVQQVWQEYMYGLEGNPSVFHLEQTSGRSWRISSAAQKLFVGRNKIYDCIRKIKSLGKTEDEAVSDVEALRINRGWNLDELQTHVTSLCPGVTNIAQPYPIYRLSLKLDTVKEVWTEFRYGLGGKPSVESLVDEYGLQWISSNASRVSYYRRKKIYEYIKDLIAGGMEEEEAVDKLERFRIARGWPLGKLQENIGNVVLN